MKAKLCAIACVLAMLVVFCGYANGGKETASGTKPADKLPQATTAIVLDFTPVSKLIEPGKYEPLSTPAEIRIGTFEVWDLSIVHPANELGFLKDVGLRFSEIKEFNKETPLMEALDVGSIDLGGTAAIVSVPLAKTLKNIVWGPAYDMWWGNAVMVRPGTFKTYDEILKEVNGDEKKAAYLVTRQLKGKTINAMLGAGHEPFIDATLAAGGLTRADVKINDLAHTESAAAFIRGEGDAYIGDLPGRYRVAETGAIPMVDSRIMGQEGWCYVGYLFNRQWLQKNEETALRFISTMYRVADVLKGPDVDKALEIMRVHVNKQSGANFTLEQGHVVNNQISPWFTFEEAKNVLFTPSSVYYWGGRINWLIDWYKKQGKLEAGDVTYAQHSAAEDLYFKLAKYKGQSETDMGVAVAAYNASSKKDQGLRLLIEKAKWNWDMRNYLDAATLASQARQRAGK